MTSYQDLPVEIHSKLVDSVFWEDGRDAAAIATWYALRAVNQKGSGNVSFHIKDIAKLLKRTPATVRRHLKAGFEKGFFRHYEKTGKGTYRVFLSGLFKVCRILGLKDWGDTSQVLSGELHGMKCLSVETAIAKLQRGSMFHAKRKHKRGVPKIDNLLPSSEKGVPRATGGVLFIGKRYVFVREEFVLIGVSQKAIAEHLDLSQSTIKRRVSNPYREKRGIVPVLKRQIVRRHKLATEAVMGEAFNQEAFALRYGKYAILAKLPESEVAAFEPFCNVYEVNSIRRSKKKRRTQYSLFLEKNPI